MIDIQEKKQKILEFLKTSGPSLPVQTAKIIEMDPVFASAILSELLDSREIKLSHMKVGSSPLYLIPGDEKSLETKTEYLKSAEKQAQEKLKSQKIIYDEQESPATRIALRNIKDFAIPFKFKEKIAWKYAFTPKEEINELLFPKPKEKQKEPLPKIDNQQPATDSEPVPKAWEVKKEEIKKIKEEPKKLEQIFQEKEHEKEPKQSQTFLEKIEHFLEKHDTTITSIEEVDKKKVTAIVKSPNETSMLFAFNRLRITEPELLTCYKQATKKDLPYQIITKAKQTKKLTETIQAYQNLLKIEKLEP